MEENLNHLRSQVNRLEQNIDALLSTCVSAQKVIDLKTTQIKELEDRLKNAQK